MKPKNYKFQTYSAIAPSRAARGETTKPKSFEDLVKFHNARLRGDKAKAIDFVVKHYPAEHQAYLARVRAGELILF